MKLIVVESPTKARTLGKFLGSEFDVEATTGHIKDLPKSKLGVDVEHDFEPQYETVAKRKSTIKLIKDKSKKAKAIFIATDPDREGEAIASHVQEIIEGKSSISKRIAFHEITKDAVEEAIANPRDIDRNLVDAQIARRVLDRLVGYELSPLLWKKVRRGLSAGRVQSVAVRLIVEKEAEIEKFKPTEYWEIFADFNKFTAQLVKDIKDKKSSDEVLSDLKGEKYIVSDVRKRQVVKSSYPPFTTSTMTQAGARLFGWSAKRTMRAAQGLYEEGLITYHRTDSLNLSQAAVVAARNYIQKEYGDKYLPEKPRYFKTTNKVAQEAHEAIRPTNVNAKPQMINAKLDHSAQKLYELIWKRFVACQMAPAIYAESTIEVTVGKYLFRASGQIMVFDGWRKLFVLDKDVVILPEVKVGEEVNPEKVWAEQKFTLPPARFNEASLIKTLEKLGIGRPSTYAPIITTIQLRNYVEKNDGKFFATVIGKAVTEFLMSNFDDIVDYKFTAEMEANLDNIANGDRKWQKEMKTFWKPFKKKVDDVTKNAKRVKIEVEKLGKKCPDCNNGELVIRVGRFGKFISCSNFPDCKHTEKYLEKIGVICPDCKKGDVIVKRSRKGKFYGCSRYPDCKYASWKMPKNEQL